MNKLRVLAWVTLILISIVFVLMTVALFLSNYPMFFAAGGLLVVLIIVGYVLKAANRKRSEAEDRENEERK